MLTIDTKSILVEYAKIHLGTNTSWKGDRLYNADFYLRYDVSELPESFQIANNIEANIMEASDLTELHPDWIKYIVKRINNGRNRIYG